MCSSLDARGSGFDAFWPSGAPLVAAAGRGFEHCCVWTSGGVQGTILSGFWPAGSPSSISSSCWRLLSVYVGPLFEEKKSFPRSTQPLSGRALQTWPCLPSHPSRRTHVTCVTSRMHGGTRLGITGASLSVNSFAGCVGNGWMTATIVPTSTCQEDGIQMTPFGVDRMFSTDG